MDQGRRDFLKHSAVALAVAALGNPAAAARAETMNSTAEFRQFLDASSGELVLGGRPLSWWVDNFDLPLHVSYAPDIRANVRAFQQVFRDHYPRGEVRYAGKADTHPTIFKLVGEEGAGIDVASPYEAEAALAAGIPADRLDLNGNAKDDGLIRLAIEKDMLIVIDSVEELERTAMLAQEQQRAPRAVLRVSGFDLGPVTASAIFTAGVWTKFGITINEIPALLPRLAEMPVRVLGFHTHIGRQITDVAAYSAVLGKLLELGALLNQAGHDFTVVNIGGGYPVSYVSKEEWHRIVARIRDGYIATKAGDASKIYLWEN